MPAPNKGTLSAPQKETASGFEEAVVLLRPCARGSVPTPKESVRLAKVALDKAARASGMSANASTIFDAMHSFSVRAPKPFIDALRSVQEVAQVLPNQLQSSPLIEPVKRSRVTLPKL